MVFKFLIDRNITEKSFLTCMNFKEIGLLGFYDPS